MHTLAPVSADSRLIHASHFERRPTPFTRFLISSCSCSPLVFICVPVSVSFAFFSIFFLSEAAIGEGADFSTNDCYSEFDGDNGACLVSDNYFYKSRTGNKGAVIQIGGGDDPMRLEINRCVMVNTSCGKVRHGVALWQPRHARGGPVVDVYPRGLLALTEGATARR